MAKYVFVKVTDKQAVEANDVDTAIQTALAQKIFEIAEINDYVVLRQNSDDSFSSGTIRLDVDWG